MGKELTAIPFRGNHLIDQVCKPSQIVIVIFSAGRPFDRLRTIDGIILVAGLQSNAVDADRLTPIQNPGDLSNVLSVDHRGHDHTGCGTALIATHDKPFQVRPQPLHSAASHELPQTVETHGVQRHLKEINLFV